METRVPLLEFDPAPVSLIEPIPLTTTGPVPDRAVICFFHDVIAERCGEGRAVPIATFRWARGDSVFYRLDTAGGPVGVFYPGVGAPLACGSLEDAIASGCTKFVACGGAGAVRPELALGHVIVPTAAIRDEGTSYHYLPPAREVAVDPRLVDSADPEWLLRDDGSS
jgi:nucleoside phosphorylase